MASKAKAIEEQPGAAPIPARLEDHPFVAERLGTSLNLHQQRDRTTALCLRWEALGEQIKTARRELWNYCEPGPDGSIMVADCDGMQAAQSVLDGLKDKRVRAEEAIKQIISSINTFWIALQARFGRCSMKNFLIIKS